jgi:ribosomal subunit interface protein
VEIAVTGRHTQVSDRFRAHIEDKLSKVPLLAPRVQRVEVIVSHEHNRRQSKAGERVEITCHVKGPVIRAESCQEDKYAALDLAMDKLLERLRRAHDRRKVHRGRRAPESVHQATSRVMDESLNNDVPAGAGGGVTAGPVAPSANGQRPSGRASQHGSGERGVEHPRPSGELDLFGIMGDSPIEVREKVHSSTPMALDEALREMELVGHDFFLYFDSETNSPSVVYRRRGWSYGVIRLEVSEAREDVEVEELAV